MMPPDLGTAISTEPMWLQVWVMLLVITHLAALFFIAFRQQGQWGFRKEPVGILVSFFAAAVLMTWIFAEAGYVRLLGVAHLVFWTPVYIWVAKKRADIGFAGVYGKYIHLYLAVAGISLVIDLIDLVRYLLGDGQLI